MVCLYQIVIWGPLFFFCHRKATRLPERGERGGQEEPTAGETGLRKQHRNRKERNSFAPSVYEALQAQKEPPPRRELVMGLGPARARPSVLLELHQRWGRS